VIDWVSCPWQVLFSLFASWPDHLEEGTIHPTTSRCRKKLQLYIAAYHPRNVGQVFLASSSALFSAMRSFIPKFGVAVEPEVEQSVRSADNTDKEVGIRTQDVSTERGSDEISAEAQPGVQKIEAITKVWSKTHLVTAYIM